MAQPPNPNPTVRAKIDSSTTEVSLRDWLNTRLAPFLKRSITESLDSEAQYPLQWLGEHLIQQSILFEGNPDSTNIKERFVYSHDDAAKPTRSGGQEQQQPTASPPSLPPAAQLVPDQPQRTLSPPVASGQEENPNAQEGGSNQSMVSNEAMNTRVTSSVGDDSPSVNGTMQVEQPAQHEHRTPTEPTQPAQDAEMTNAP